MKKDKNNIPKVIKKEHGIHALKFYLQEITTLFKLAKSSLSG